MGNKHIVIIGAGYVGLAHACLFALHTTHEITLVENDPVKLKLLEKGISPLEEFTKEYAQAFELAQIDVVSSIEEIPEQEAADIVFVAVPTDSKSSSKELDTSILSSVLKNTVNTWLCPIVIKSTVPIGYTSQISTELSTGNICFSPEFLREGSAYKDLLNPSRIVIGTDRQDLGQRILDTYYLKAIEELPWTFIVSPTEAESSKLFANTYLAMRVAFFNELDTYAMKHGLRSKAIIDIIGKDDRIGRGYNNPSFGFGGYCLPKDSAQMSTHVKDFGPRYLGLGSPLIEAIPDSNQVRKASIQLEFMLKYPGLTEIGFYDIAMKSGSDNIRSSASFELLSALSEKEGVTIHLLKGKLPQHSKELCNFVKEAGNIIIWDNLETFVRNSQVIIVNRMDDVLRGFPQAAGKIFTRDIYGNG